jgi:hypothetical protein
MLRESGASSTPQLLDFAAHVSGILDRPHARAMTVWAQLIHVFNSQGT